ncbi:MAG: response regulator transcription factor [Myxococcota bacterium]
MRKAQLLLVEDDDEFAELLASYLRPQGFELARVASGDVGAERILVEQPDLVILDLMLPGANGLDVVRRVREGYAGAILMLTASQSEADHVAGLELGADDFVIKPIEPRVLLARIRSQLRRSAGSRPTEDPDRLHVGPIHIDVATRDVRIDDAPVSLTSMEFDVLRMLAAQAGTVVARDDLYTRLLGIEYDGLDRGMDVHVSRLRRKLERAGLDRSRIKSVRGVGYLLACR